MGNWSVTSNDIRAEEGITIIFIFILIYYICVLLNGVRAMQQMEQQ